MAHIPDLEKVQTGVSSYPFPMICRKANPEISPEMKRSRDSDNCRYLVCLSTRSHHRAGACQRWASERKSANICIRNPWFWAKFCPQYPSCIYTLENFEFFLEFSRPGFWVNWPGNLSRSLFKGYVMALRFAIFDFRLYFFIILGFLSFVGLRPRHAQHCHVKWSLLIMEIVFFEILFWKCNNKY